MNQKQRRIYTAAHGGFRTIELDKGIDRPSTDAEIKAHIKKGIDRRKLLAGLIVGGVIFVIILMGIIIAVFGGAESARVVS